MLSLGVPVVASDIDGNRYMLKGGAGLLFPCRDARALSDALYSLFCDEARHKRLSREGYASYKAFFCADAMARSYERLYKRIVFEKKL
jgi:glycosyltransferase involved in cell wall biosynthesis